MRMPKKMSEGQGRLIILSGPSGVGKTTIADRLLETTSLERVITATTRAPREGEVDGRDYHFMTLQEFRDAIRDGRFLEHAEVYGNLYGTPREDVEDALAAGRQILLNIDVQGARQVREVAKELPLASIFLTAPSLEELENRIRGRNTNSEEDLQKRLAAARLELAEKRHYHHVVVNDRVEEAVDKIRGLLGSRSGDGSAK